MPEFNLTPQLIFEETDGGLQIITDYYPEAAEAARTKRHFKTREEKTASSTIREYNGVWYVKDFGSSDKAKDAISIVMEEENFQFVEALNFIASKYNIQTQNAPKPKAVYGYEQMPAEDGEQVGDISFETKDFEMETLKTITAYQVWNRLKRVNLQPADNGKLEEKSDTVAARNAAEVARRLGLYNLCHYTFVSREKNGNNLKKSKYKATDTYPILMWEAGNWRKIYKPKEADKKRRFLIEGKKDRRMFGYADASMLLDDFKNKELKAENLTWDSDNEKVKEIRNMKLNEIIICSGGSDAFNIRCCGYAVIWFDNEMFNLKSDEYTKLFSIAHRVYYLPDIDSSGVKEALKMGKEYLNIELIFLPEKLREEYDFRGNSCKDVRDFFRRHTDKDFDNLIAQAMPLRFWDQAYKRTRDGQEVIKRGIKLMEFKPNPELISNFLYREGFAQYPYEDDKRGYTIVHCDENVIEGDVNFETVFKHAKAFLKSDPVMRLVKHNYLDLANAFNKSTVFTENILKQLPEKPLNFKSYGKHFQYMFFERNAWKIFPDRIEEFKLEECPVNVWKDEVIPGKGKLSGDPYVITKKGELYDIEIKESDNMYLNFLIQTSRIHWREELEVKLDAYDFSQKHMDIRMDDVKDKESYLKKFRFCLDGPLLTAEQIHDQKLVLISKLSAFGYLMHRHKDKAKSYCVWGTDHSGTQTTEEAQFLGGTGKSISFDLLRSYHKFKRLDGQNDEQMKDKHNLEGTTKHTGIIYVDDAGRYLQFERFFSIVTTFCQVNPKGRSEYVIDFEEAPKLAITSNLPPKKNDPSTRRRMWFVTFADYYHKNVNGGYREDRFPLDDFNVTLFDKEEFPEAQWQKTHNLMARTIQTWLKFGKIDGVEDVVVKNILLNKMTLNFKAWADAAFHPDNGRLNTYVQRVSLYSYYQAGQSHPCTPQNFMDKLSMWCEYNGYIFNPRERLTSGGRIMKHVETEDYVRGEFIKKDAGVNADGTRKYVKETRECIFIATPDGLVAEKEDDMPF